MHHVLPTILLIPIILWFLAKKGGIRRAYYLLSWVPASLLALAFTTQHLFGYGVSAHALFHFAYDTSYILTLIGLLLLLYFVFKKERPLALMLALVVTSIPLVQLLLY